MKTTIYLCGVLLILSGAVFAEDNAPVAEQPQFITPDKMTEDDYQLLNDYTGNYNQCLSDTSIQQAQTQTDPRQVVDFAMKFCAVHLIELQQKMNERNFDPNFIDNYLHRTSTKGANNALRVMMFQMANKQSAGEQTPAGPVPVE